MAKSKKTDGASEPAPKKEPAARKSPAAKGAAPSKAAAGAAPAARAPAMTAKTTVAATTPTPTPAKKAPAGKKAGRADKAPAARPPQPQAPLIDTGLAAQAAASMIANRFVTGAATGPAGHGAAPPPAGASQESSAFKSLKEGLNKPSVGGLGGILGAGGGSRKPNAGFGGPKPSVPGGAKNQTFGADINRAGVPRRTGG